MILVNKSEFEESIFNESLVMKIGKREITIDPVRKPVGTSANRRGSHDNRIKASVSGNTKIHATTTTVPLFYGANRDTYGDLILEDIQYGTELNNRQKEDTENAIIAIYNYAKEEMKEFYDTDDISSLKKKVEDFNKLSNKEKEKYYEI